ncbi:MAG TPA: hypothetical protein VF092_04840 [Longimicrobium sp.]
MRWNWSTVNWFGFLPPLLSIYLLLVSGFTKRFLATRIQTFVAREEGLTNKKDVIRNVAAGWASLLGFFNALFAALLAPISIYSTSRSFGWLAATLILIVFTFIPMFWWVQSFDLDELQTGATLFGWSPATLCKIVLIIVNLVLLAAIGINQQLAVVNP